jgi:raffinose/stachyose/melibiose transport system permease protein
MASWHRFDTARDTSILCKSIGIKFNGEQETMVDAAHRTYVDQPSADPRQRYARASKPPSLARSARRYRGVAVPFWMALPALVAYAFVTLFPSGQGAVVAFSNWDGISSTYELIGFSNFERLFSDPRALGAFGNTLALAATVMFFQNGIGLALALALNSAVRSRNLLRVIFFAPVVLTPLVSGYIWSYMLAPQGGVNSALRSVGLNAMAHDWLGDPRFALGAVCVAIIWQFSGYSMVIFLAGLQAIPVELTEAAAIDGAGPARRFVSITLPLLNGAIVINLLLTLISGLGQFDQVIAMTNGGPGTSTETISTSIYKIGFQLGDYAYGTALALSMTVVVAVLAFAQYRLTSRQVR